MRRPLYWCWLLLLVMSLVHAQQAPTAPGFVPLGPGLHYQLERDGDTPWAICELRVDRAHTEYHLVSTLAQNSIFGLATVSEQVKSLPAELGTPVAAVNGDWFDLPAGPYQGDLINLFIHRGQLVSLPTEGDTCWLDAQGQPHVARVTTELTVTWPDGTRTPLGLDGPRKDDAAVLYTPILGPSTHTTGGRELVLERNGDGPWLPLKVGQTYSARVREVRDAGDTPLAADTMVLSLGEKLQSAPAKLDKGAVVQLSVTSTPDLSGSELAIGGKPMLLQNGKVQVTDPGGLPRHPRTAFGWNATQYFFVVVDGRRDGWSAGMTVPELAALMHRLGCTDAINLDGGGSSTLWLNDAIMNMPSDGHLRSVGNALVLVKK